MHVPESDQLRQAFGLHPLPLSSETPPAVQGDLAVPLDGSIISAPTPSGGLAQGASSWDPTIFRPDKPVSCYCGLQFSSPEEPTVSMKPGTGIPKPGCGKWVRTIQSGTVIKKIVHNCDVLSCPTCMPGAITQKANDVESRFDRYEEAKMAENAVLVPGELKKPGIKGRHFVFTMAPAYIAVLVAKVRRNAGKWDPELFLDYVRSELKIALKFSGLVGGFVVYHDARVRHPDTGLTGSRAKHLIRMEAMAEGNMSDDDPDWKLYDHIRKQKNPSRYYYFSPHFHVMAFGKIKPIQEFEEMFPGWSYHNKKDIGTPGGLARYLFSHMAMFENRHACTWFGRLHQTVLRKQELRSYEQPVLCPETGTPYVIIASAILGEVGAEYREKITEYLGYFQPRRKREKKQIDPGDLWKKMEWPGRGQRPGAPTFVKERGIRVMSEYCDENGRF